MEVRLGNIFGFTGGNYAGNVYDKDHLSHTIKTMQGGSNQPMIVETNSIPKCLNPKGGRCGVDGLQPSVQDRVYSVDGISTSITTSFMPSILESKNIIEANSIRMVRTEEGKALRKQYENHEIHHGFNEHREPELRKDGVTNTLSTVQKDNYICVAMRGRNQTNPSDRTPGIELEQTLEVNQNGTSNCLTSVQKDNLVLENVYDFYNDKMKQDGVCGTLTTGTAHNGSGSFGVVEGITTKGKHIDVARTILSGYERTNMTGFNADNGVLERPVLLGGVGEENEFGTQYRQGNRVYSSNAVAMCLNSQPVGNTGGNSYLYNVNYRIRKLTPRECWRLMDFSDEDFEKAAEVNSNTQLYKQAGNSIIRNVLVAILGQLIEGKEDAYRKI